MTSSPDVEPDLPVRAPHRASEEARPARMDHEHAVAPSRAPRQERAVHWQELRRHLHRGDRLFGSFQAEGERVEYGLTRDVGTFNPAPAVSRARRISRGTCEQRPSWRARLGYVLDRQCEPASLRPWRRPSRRSAVRAMPAARAARPTDRRARRGSRAHRTIAGPGYPRTAGSHSRSSSSPYTARQHRRSHVTYPRCRRCRRRGAEGRQGRC